MRIAVSKLKMHASGTPLAVTISCGVTQLMPEDSATSVFDRAETLYAAKEAGRDRYLSSDASGTR